GALRRRVALGAELGPPEDDGAKQLAEPALADGLEILLAELPRAVEVARVHVEPRRLEAEGPRPQVVAVLLRHGEAVGEDAARRSPCAEVQERPRPVELTGHVVVRVADLEREREPLLGDVIGEAVLGPVTLQMGVVADVLAQADAISRLAGGVDGAMTGLRVL